MPPKSTILIWIVHNGNHPRTRRRFLLDTCQIPTVVLHDEMVVPKWSNMVAGLSVARRCHQLHFIVGDEGGLIDHVQPTRSSHAFFLPGTRMVSSSVDSFAFLT